MRIFEWPLLRSASRLGTEEICCLVIKRNQLGTHKVHRGVVGSAKGVGRALNSNEGVRANMEQTESHESYQRA